MDERNRTWLRPERVAIAVLAVALAAVVATEGKEETDPTRLAIVWSSDDPYVAHRVCLMYTHAAKTAGWFDEVKLVVWGPSAKLLAEDKELQAKVKAMQESGVVTQACIVCADAYNVTDELRQLGLEVKGMRKTLSDMLQSDWKVLTF